MVNIVARFIKDFSYALEQGVAAVFAGAGMSRESGYVNWKELLRTFAEDIRLDIDKETDLISVAQYYKNEMGGNRYSLNQEIINKFTLQAQNNTYMDALTRLPIKTYWTTNYDHIIENSIREKTNAQVDVKINSDNLATIKANSDVIVYKFHGDVDFPADAVLTKEDYELFDVTHKLFITALQGDLISKTFLFIGYSFNDPNLDLILSRIRILMGDNKREHYCLIRKEQRSDYDTEDDFLYAKIKQELKSKDLLRYGIHTIFIDDYTDIPILLNKIYTTYMSKKIFIAGSCRNYMPWNPQNAYQFLYNLGYELIKNGYKVSSGFSEGVGPQVVNGAITAINQLHLNIEKNLQIKPLPLIDGNADNINPSAKQMFQNDMIEQSGIIIFLFGNQYYNNGLEISKGVLHDYERAQKYNRFIIPVGSTGYAAEIIQNEMEKLPDQYKYLSPYWFALKSTRDPQKLVKLILEIIKSITYQY